MAGIPAMRSNCVWSTAQRKGHHQPPTVSPRTTEQGRRKSGLGPTAQNRTTHPESHFLPPREPVVAQQGIPDAQRGARDILYPIVCGFGEFRERFAELGGCFCGFLLEGVRPACLGEIGVDFRAEVGQGGGNCRDGLYACT